MTFMPLENIKQAPAAEEGKEHVAAMHDEVHGARMQPAVDSSVAAAANGTAQIEEAGYRGHGPAIIISPGLGTGLGTGYGYDYGYGGNYGNNQQMCRELVIKPFPYPHKEPVLVPCQQQMYRPPMPANQRGYGGGALEIPGGY